MSGHSKWATTHRKKELIDAKRGKIFTKLAKLVTIAARDGKSGDPAMNPSLRMAIETARAASMPKDNIDRAIKRGLGEGGGSQIEEVIYEAYAPFGIAMLIECLTDNKNRTLGEIKALLNKAGGTLATAGSVSYLFKKIGQIIIDESKSSIKGEELELAIIESGAENFEKEENLYVIETTFQSLHPVKKALEDTGIAIDSAEFTQIAETLVDLPDDRKQTILNLVDKIDDLDDVNNVFTNLNI
ncbi:MAG: YebC/PmpR family DNA-binding transcriptional regulator [Patescibacteria group bacterium]|nr:YebC/PmpR family DNA-binding transcriptional regulator [Patescibacteria group bacterium]